MEGAVISQELSEKEVGPEGTGKSAEDGGYEQFSVGGICGVNVCCVPNFCVVVFQHLFSSIYWNFAVGDGGTVSHNCFGQIACPLVSFQTHVSFDPVEGDRGIVNLIIHSKS
jgi:hypothetical protein